MNIPTSYTRQLAEENETLRQQRDELRDLAEKYLHAREKEAGTRFSLEVAADNFTNSKPERDKHFQATIEASKAEKELYQAIERCKP